MHNEGAGEGLGRGGEDSKAETDSVHGGILERNGDQSI